MRAGPSPRAAHARCGKATRRGRVPGAKAQGLGARVVRATGGAERVDAERLALGGEDAGGKATVVFVERGERLRAAALIEGALCGREQAGLGGERVALGRGGVRVTRGAGARASAGADSARTSVGAAPPPTSAGGDVATGAEDVAASAATTRGPIDADARGPCPRAPCRCAATTSAAPVAPRAPNVRSAQRVEGARGVEGAGGVEGAPRFAAASTPSAVATPRRSASRRSPSSRSPLRARSSSARVAGLNPSTRASVGRGVGVVGPPTRTPPARREGGTRWSRAARAVPRRSRAG